MATSLSSPLRLRDITLRNRIVVSPMCEYSSADGFATDWHMVHLGSRAVGGAGAVLTEASAVTADGRISAADLGIYSDDHVEPLARIFRFIEVQGAVPGMQLAHAGRKASTAQPWKGGGPVAPADGGWTPIWAPSAIAFRDGWQVPRAMAVAEIQQVVQAFAAGARRLLAAGGRIAEVHAAHGYLLHEFLSPLSNHRDDEYGGSFENRTLHP
jgi:2,4-dienoyl-CoA reductase-like NADH-dependent reductase (Old Yellow Enzyme family)